MEAQKRDSVVHNRYAAHKDREKRKEEGVMARKQYFTVRLNRIRVVDNREWGPAEVKILSFITAGNDSLPVLEGYTATNSDDEKRKIIAQAARDLVSFREFIEVQHVRDDCYLTFGSADAGISVFTTDKIPVDFNWSLVLIERDSDIRKVGEAIESILNSSEFDTFATDLIGFIATTAKPEITIAFKIGKYVAAQIGKGLANNKDDQVGLFATSLNRFQHYTNGERKRDNVPGVNANIFIDYTVFGTEYEG